MKHTGFNRLVPPEEEQEPEHVVCPFCKVADFDLEGLKGHLMNGYCKVYEETEWEAIN